VRASSAAGGGEGPRWCGGGGQGACRGGARASLIGKRTKRREEEGPGYLYPGLRYRVNNHQVPKALGTGSSYDPVPKTANGQEQIPPPQGTGWLSSQGNKGWGVSVVFLFWFCYVFSFQKSFNSLKIKYELKNSSKNL
jgi:hypothetical protein